MIPVAQLRLEISTLLQSDQIFEDGQLERLISRCGEFFSSTNVQVISQEEASALRDDIEELLNTVTAGREELRQMLEQAPRRNQAINAYAKQSFQE